MNMNPDNAQERNAPFPDPSARQRPQPYKFSQDEIRVLKECNKESFYGRCLPFGTVLGGLTYYGIHTGFLKRSGQLGAVPKVAAAVVVGYFLGKFSYHQKCAEKFMALPDSRIGRLMKARRLGIPDDEVEQPIGSFSISPFSGITDSYSDIPDVDKSYDYDNQHTPEGLDDSFRPSMDNPIKLHEEEMPPEQKNFTTYEELRKKNREEYEQKRISTYRQIHTPPSPPSQPSPAARQPEFGEPSSTAPKNQYGDIWG